jgi:AraC family transcriptional regulator
MRVEAELRVPLATSQLIHFNITTPSDDIFLEKDGDWLDLCLTPRPRNARACYREHWSPHRFERLGDVFLVPAGKAIHVKGECGRQASVVCLLRREPIRAWFDGEMEWNDRRLEASLDIGSSTIKGLLLRLGEEMRHPGFASAMLGELIAAQIVIELARYYAAVTTEPTTGGLAPWRLRMIDERLMELREMPTLAELAGLCKLSVRQLTRGFRVSRGCSIGDYVSQSRIDTSKRLLARENSIKAIAYAMGFASPSAFCYAFRHATGETPRQYRQRILRVRG